MKVEYRVRPVTRHHVTRYYETDNTGGVEQKGEYDNYQTAYEVAYALCKHEHQELGYPLDDERVLYPVPPEIAAMADESRAEDNLSRQGARST